MLSETAPQRHQARQLCSGSLDKSKSLRYKIRMVVTSIRELNRAVPFKPYTIHMASGESFKVPHPDFIMVSPKGSFVIVMDAEEYPHHLNSLLIERVSLRNGHRPRKNGKRP
jgi:hypothetical protein